MTDIKLEKSIIPSDSIPEASYFFIYQNNSIFVDINKGNEFSIPFMEMNEALKLKLKNICFIGLIKKRACYSAHLSTRAQKTGLKSINIRALHGKVDLLFWNTAGYARQIHDWNLNFKYCGRCGQTTEKKESEHVRVCPGCNLMSYPRISPAAIIAVVKENQILLARGVNFPNEKMYSVLAGFVEPGETLEACVKREVYEETGIRVKNIKYFKSQPWPFPDSLMIGFTAEYESGDIVIDADEIVQASWFSPDKLPLIPSKYTIARELIDWFVENNHP